MLQVTTEVIKLLFFRITNPGGSGNRVALSCYKSRGKWKQGCYLVLQLQWEVERGLFFRVSSPQKSGNRAVISCYKSRGNWKEGYYFVLQVPSLGNWKDGCYFLLQVQRELKEEQCMSVIRSLKSNLTYGTSNLNICIRFLTLF